MSPFKLSTIAFIAVAGLATAANGAGQLPPASTKSGVTYATDIKPILDTSCVKCHSGEKPKAKLMLDSLDDILKGGRDGKVVLAGDSAKSPLVLGPAHATEDQDLWMPPKKFEGKFPPLTPDQIGLLRAWIDQGAK